MSQTALPNPIYGLVRPRPVSCNISREPMPTFYDRFVECVEQWPQNVALEIQRRDQVESYTYAEVRRMAESVGSWLAKSGLQPGARVAILADNHPRWVAVFLGTVAAGCTAVPLDTALHADQITTLLKDSGSSLLFCDGKHLHLFFRSQCFWPPRRQPRGGCVGPCRFPALHLGHNLRSQGRDADSRQSHG